MGNLDLKFYWAVFLRRLPYFILVSGLIAALGVTVAAILPPVYVSNARILVEPQQIPDDLAQSTVPIDPYEQIQIIQQRVMTRINLLALAEKIGLADDMPDASAEDLIQATAQRITFTGSEPEDTGRTGPLPGAMVVGISFEADNAAQAARGANEIVNLTLEENVRIRTGRATDTLNFFETEVEKLSEALKEKSREVAEFKTGNVEALPDSLEARRQQQLIEQERLLALEREETSLRNERATAIWVYERTGRSSTLDTRSLEEEQLEVLRSERLQKLAIYAPSSNTIRVLENQIRALETLVEEQRQTRAFPNGEGSAEPATELDLELAPIDARLAFIGQEKQMIEDTLAELQASVAATPRNEMVLNGLESELDTLRQQYDDASANLAQARRGERIEASSKGQRLTMIEQPIEAPYPTSPNRKLIAAAGMVGGVGAGLGLIVLLELLNRSIRRSIDLSNHLGIQPLATIPYIHTRRERRFKRTVIALALCAIFVVLPSGLFMIHTYYMPLDLLIKQVKGTLSGDIKEIPVVNAPPAS
jgi:polysaccharide biosynthesis transport protein